MITNRNSIAKKIIPVVIVMMIMSVLFAVPAFAAGDVSSFVTETWGTVKGQLTTIVDNVVFPILIFILVIFLIVSISKAALEYRKSHQIEYTNIVLALFGLAFAIAAKVTWHSMIS